MRRRGQVSPVTVSLYLLITLVIGMILLYLSGEASRLLIREREEEEKEMLKYFGGKVAVDQVYMSNGVLILLVRNMGRQTLDTSKCTVKIVTERGSIFIFDKTKCISCPKIDKGKYGELVYNITEVPIRDVSTVKLNCPLFFSEPAKRDIFRYMLLPPEILFSVFFSTGRYACGLLFTTSSAVNVSVRIDYSRYGVKSVRFYLNDVLIKEDRDPPYEATISNISGGDVIRVVVTDNLDNSASKNATIYYGELPIVDEFNVTGFAPVEIEGYQLRREIGRVIENLMVCTSDSEVPFCFEQENGECNRNPTDTIWIKLKLPPASRNLTIYLINYSSPRALTGREVFDAYYDFSTSIFPDYSVTGDPTWSWRIENESLVIDYSGNSVDDSISLYITSVVKLSDYYGYCFEYIGRNVNVLFKDSSDIGKSVVNLKGIWTSGVGGISLAGLYVPGDTAELYRLIYLDKSLYLVSKGMYLSPTEILRAPPPTSTSGRFILIINGPGTIEGGVEWVRLRKCVR